MLAERLDVGIGVGTHKHRHTAAVVSLTGAVLDEITVPANPGWWNAWIASRVPLYGDRRGP
jgi:hypothetical protein